MRIAIISSTFDRHHRRRNAIYNGLLQFGHDCELFGISYPHLQVDFPDGVTLLNGYKSTPSKFINGIRAKILQVRTIAALKNFRPECIIAMDPDTLYAGVFFKKNFGTRFVYDVQEFHGHTSKATPNHRKWVEKKERLASQYIDQVLVLSEPMKSFMSQKVGRDVPIDILSNAISDWTKQTYNGYLHKAAGLNRDHKILLYHGYLAEHRGLEWLSEFSPKLPPNWHIILMGWGPLEKQLMASENAQFSVIGPVNADRLLSAISGADIGLILYNPVNSNHIYSTPNKLYEYPAAGVPILTANLGQIAPVVREFEMGWVLTDQSPEEEILSILSRFDEGEEYNVRLVENCGNFIRSVEFQCDPAAWQTLITGQTNADAKELMSGKIDLL